MANSPGVLDRSGQLAGLEYGPAARHRLDVYQPAAGRPAPVIVFLHGGAWTSGSRGQYAFVGRSLASRGYVAVVPDYGLHPAVGFPEFVRDAARAVAFTLEHSGSWGGDPCRVFLAGHSAGAHLALLVALDTRYLAGLGGSPDRLRGVIGLSGPYSFRLSSDFLRDLFGSAADPADSQPISFARGDAPPALLLHGEADRVVGAANTTRLVAAIREQGGTVDFRFYPGVGHGGTVAVFAGLRRQPPVLLDMALFIDRLGRLPQPAQGSALPLLRPRDAGC